MKKTRIVIMQFFKEMPYNSYFLSLLVSVVRATECEGRPSRRKEVPTIEATITIVIALSSHSDTVNRWRSCFSSHDMR